MLNLDRLGSATCGSTRFGLIELDATQVDFDFALDRLQQWPFPATDTVPSALATRLATRMTIVCSSGTKLRIFAMRSNGRSRLYHCRCAASRNIRWMTS